ncbi:MAG: hypothetical protein GW802_39465, partial [Armatimonadetes bacterium]|nr:hypothetical protein [Armatimonadota bacterium]
SLSALRDALSVAKAARLLNSKMVTDIRNLLSLATEMVAKSKDDGAPPE